MHKRWTAWTAVLAVCAAACLASGPWHETLIEVTSNTTNATAYVATTNSAIRGQVWEILLDLPAKVTGTVSMVVDPYLSGMDDLTLISTNGLVDELRWRPRFDAHDAAAAALTGDPPEPIVVIGEHVIMGLTNCSVTSATVRAVVKWRE